ncbi:FliH/SctL family protein [Pseudolysinimonas sp.]|uniref:FliH/SctL family protein n=1 Tax=Pseudolysinimonas sp. TaxID=2680009 RepID=UPI003F7F1AD0
MSEAFALVAFPSLTPDRPSAEAEAAGRAAGYAAGRRAAEAELAQLRARAETEAADGAAAARARIEAALTLLGTAADEFAQRSVPVLDAFDEALLAAAVQIAEAILQRELADETAAALGAVRRAMAVGDPAELRRVRLHPADLAMLTGLGELPVEVLADPSIARGDAVADLARGSIDARLGTAVERVRAALADHRGAA